MDWTKVKILGAGTFGIVSLWYCTSTGEFVAVKKFRIPNQYSRDLSILELYKKLCKTEVEIMRGINHRNIVTAIIPSQGLADNIREAFKSSGSSDGSDIVESPHQDLPFLCMEYCSKGDLRQLLRRPENFSGLQEHEILAILSNISDAIIYLHHEKIILHRDIKPENIVIQWDPVLMRPIYKLSDFGLAKDVSSLDSLCSTHAGTVEYLAPEIRSGIRYDRTVDLWSFGLVVYEISCGRLPFTRENLPGFRSRLPLSSKQIPERTHLSELYRRNLSNWLPSMLQFDPAKRGKLRMLKDNKEVSTCSLAWLRNLLDSSFLHIHSEVAGRLVFRVLETTTMAEVYWWIYNMTNLPVEDQMILKLDGTELTSEELAMHYANDNNSQLFLIPKTGQQISTNIVLPKSLNSLLIESGDDCDATKLKELWIADIFHIQTQLTRAKESLKAEEALKNKHFRTGNAVVAKENKKRMQDLYTRFRELRASFNAIVTMDQMLEEVDAKFQGENFPSVDNSLVEIKTSAEDLHSYTENYFQEYFQYSKDNLRLKGLTCTLLTELYEKLLREYDRWKTLTAKEEYELKNLEEVRKTISVFLTTQKTILISVDNNMKLIAIDDETILTDRLLVQRTIPQKEKEEKLLEIFEKLERFQKHIMKQRVIKQQMLFEQTLPLQTAASSSSHLQSIPQTLSAQTQKPDHAPKGFPSKLVTSVKSVFQGPSRQKGPILVSEMPRSSAPSSIDQNSLESQSDRSDNFWVVIEKQ